MQNAFKVVLIVFTISHHGHATTEILTILDVQTGDIKECKTVEIKSCRKVKVNFDLITEEAPEVTFPEGHIMTRKGPIEVSSEARGTCYEAS